MQNSLVAHDFARTKHKELKMTEDTPRPIERLARPIWPDTGEALGLCRNSVYQAAKKGDIPTIKVGGRSLVPEWFFRKLKNGG